MQPAVQVQDVTYRYGKGDAIRPVLQGVDLSIAPGEIVLLTGPSGGGKTTLLTLVGALRAVQQGSVRVLGTELAGASEAQRVALRQRIGFIFQLHNLLEFLTARQNVAMALELDSALTEAERLARSVRANLAPVVHIFTFPALTLNHAVVAYSVSESPEGFQFATYDPNAPNDILDLRFDFSRREFEMPPTLYFIGGHLDAYEVYSGFFR